MANRLDLYRVPTDMSVIPRVTVRGTAVSVTATS